MRICLFEPDIPQNTGTILRMAACFGLPVDIIEPCGFLLTSGALKRAGMDYLEKADYIRHADWRAFVEARQDGTVPGRLVLLTTKGAEPYCDFEFRADDILMLGSESKGVPDSVHDYVDARVVIPMKPQMRSLNVAMATAMTLGEALRQTDGFPASRPSERTK
ncbi:tRNA (cytidine(34)-2'-O)-methyltransferase [Thalassospira sp. CH_XMU1458]|uniref:tRNA (cytidine(34)-2'-O)-methyltransferase n=2 Tax=Thalassospiraceae TaxID=2844866 RepID=UPI00300C3E89